LFNNLTSYRRFILRKDSLFKNTLVSDQKDFTLRYSFTNKTTFFSDDLKTFYKNSLTPRYKVKHREKDSKHEIREIFDSLQSAHFKFNEKKLKLLFKNFAHNTTTPLFKTNQLWQLFNINFLKKERIYTKLKYSRVPQYDIVSGGAAALFAGFLGFLICEKFGFELVDSGDFYFFFMYLVLFFFSLRLYLKLLNNLESS
jgi:hypothetical protein